MGCGEVMKILHLHLSREFAGSETYAADIAAGQVAAGHNVAVIVRYSPAVARWRARLGGAALFVIPRGAVGPLAFWVAKHYVRGFAPDVLHSHLGRAHKMGQRLAAVLKVPHVGTMHLRYKPAEHTALDARIAIANWQVAEVPEALRAQTYVIMNGVPAMPPATPKKADKIFTFGSVGRLHLNKGMVDVVQAFQHAFKGNDDVRLEIVGEGAERANLEDLCKDDKRIVLRGSIPAAECYGGWDVYVSGARYEPFGLTLLEAMQQQLLIVATQTQGAIEIFATQKHQPHWAPCTDVEALAAALRAAYQAKQRRVAWDMTPFDPARVLAQIEDVYERVVK